MKIIKNTLIAASLVSGAQAASIIAISADQANSDSGDFGWVNVSNTLSDTASFDPDDPTAATFVQLYTNASTPSGYHGFKQSGTHVLSYLVTGGFTTSTLNPTVALDFFGRDLPSQDTRDDNYTVTLYNGGYAAGDVVAQLTGQKADDTVPGGNEYNRSSFNLGNAVTFDRFQITSAAGPADPEQSFSIAEVRLVSVEAVPEPSSTALLGLGGLALILRRRK